MIRLVQWFRHQRYALLVLLGCVLLTLLTVITLLQRSDQREFEATFLQQCHDAGYDPAKCQFFLTMSRRTVLREMVLTPK